MASAIFAILVLVGGGWFLGIAPQMSIATAANTARANVAGSNARNEILLVRLKNDFQNIDALKNRLFTLRQGVPDKADISSFVSELNTLASTRKVTLRSITVSDAKPYTPSTQTLGTGAAKTKSPQVNPRITAANFIIIPVQLTVTGDYGRVLNFVNDVQMGQRLILVSSLTTTGATDSKGAKGSPRTSGGSQKVDSTIGGYIYVLLA